MVGVNVLISLAFRMRIMGNKSSILLFGILLSFLLLVDAAKGTDDSNCKTIQNIKLRNVCYDNLGQETVNSSLCEKIQDNDYLKDSCYGGIVVMKGNPAYQKGLQLSLSDASLCDKIQDGERKSKCYLNVAAATGKLSLCLKVGGIAEKVACMAIAKRQKLFCSLVFDNDLKNECYHGVAVYKRDLSACDKIWESEENKFLYGDKKEECYIDIAIAKQDASICDKTADAQYNFDCYYYIAQVKRDESVCDRIRNGNLTGNRNLTEQCYVTVAEAKKDELTCTKIKNPGLKALCYGNVAKATQNELLCEKIVETSINSTYTPHCYSDIAVLK